MARNSFKIMKYNEEIRMAITVVGVILVFSLAQVHMDLKAHAQVQSNDSSSSSTVCANNQPCYTVTCNDNQPCRVFKYPNTENPYEDNFDDMDDIEDILDFD
jgi:hypothetical protein